MSALSELRVAYSVQMRGPLVIPRLEERIRQLMASRPEFFAEPLTTLRVVDDASVPIPPTGRPYDIVLIRLSPLAHELRISMSADIARNCPLEVWMQAVLGANNEAEPADAHQSDTSNGNHAYLQWAQALRAAPALSLPTCYPRTATRSDSGGFVSFDIPQRQASALSRLSAEQDSPVGSAFLAVFALMLHRFSGQEDILVATRFSRSDRVANLIVRTSVAGSMSLPVLITETHAAVKIANSFAGSVLAINPGYDDSVRAAFQFTSAAGSPELDVDCVTLQNDLATAEIRLNVRQGSSTWRGELEYNAALFNRAFVERMAGHYLRLLEQTVADPAVAIGDIDLLQPSESHEMLVGWNNTHATVVIDCCIHQLFERQCIRTPQATAIAFDNQTLSYEEVNRRANRLAWRLQREGVGRGTPVGVLMDRSAALPISLLAVMKAGGAYVPLDPAYPAERLRSILEDSSPSCVIAGLNSRRHLADPSIRIIDAETACSDPTCSATNLPSRLTPDDLAYFIYTSGSTGRPKGVMIDHRSAVELIAWASTVFKPDSLRMVLASTSICFDLSVFEFFVPLSLGGAVLVVRDILDWSERGFPGNVTLINTVPSALKEILRARALPRGIRVINVAGEALPEAIVNDAHLCEGLEAMYNLYGPSEDTTYSTFTRVEPNKSPLIGRPITNSRVFIVDRYGMPVPTGVPGEILIGGAGLARGYWDRADLTAEKFVPDGLSGEAGARLYRTGDLGRWNDDGLIEFLGRMDHQVKIRGHRIELGEIETALKQHVSVVDAVVAVREESTGDKRLAAYVVLHEQHRPNGPAPLRAYLAEKLPAYMMPSFLVLLDRMPLTPNGKVDRKKLPPPELSQAQELAFEEPASPLGKTIADIWESVLGCGRVGATSNFFELGGHSLLAMQVVSRLRQALGFDLTLQELFQNPVLSALAECLSERRQRPSPAAWIGTGAPAGVLSHGEQRLYFLQQFDVESFKYNMAYAARMKGELNVQALAASLSELVARHDTFRTRYVLRAEPERVVDEELDLVLRVEPVRDESEAEHAILLESQRVFDLEKGPLFRALLLRFAAGDHTLVVSMHHAIADACRWMCSPANWGFSTGTFSTAPTAFH